MGKSNFLMSSEWGPMIKSLSDEQAGMILKAVYALNDGEEYEIADPVIAAIFKMIESYLITNTEKYREKCEKNAKASRQRKRYSDDDNAESLTNTDDSGIKDTEDYQTTSNDIERYRTITNDKENQRSISDDSERYQTNSDTSLSLSQSLSLSFPDTEIREIVDYLNSKTGKKYRPSTSNTRKSIHARLSDGYTVDDFKAVIDVKANEWMGTDMEKYLSPETLFRQSHFEKYLNQAPRAKPIEAPPSEPKEEEHEMTEEEWMAMFEPGGALYDPTVGGDDG